MLLVQNIQQWYLKQYPSIFTFPFIPYSGQNVNSFPSELHNIYLAENQKLSANESIQTFWYHQSISPILGSISTTKPRYRCFPYFTELTSNKWNTQGYIFFQCSTGTNRKPSSVFSTNLIEVCEGQRALKWDGWIISIYNFFIASLLYYFSQ